MARIAMFRRLRIATSWIRALKGDAAEVAMRYCACIPVTLNDALSTPAAAGDLPDAVSCAGANTDDALT